MPVRAAVIWSLHWDSRICFQNGSLTWLLAAGFSLLPYEPGRLECPWHGSWLPQRAKDPRKGDWSQNGFYDLASEFTHHHFHRIVLVPQDNIQYRRGLPKGSTSGSGDHWGPSWRLATILVHWFIPLPFIKHQPGVWLRLPTWLWIIEFRDQVFVQYLQCLEHRKSQ